MQKITFLFTAFITFNGFAQQKSTGDMSLSNAIPITANFTLNNTSSQVTLVLKGPSDRWFGIGIGVNQGFGMQNGDALVVTTATSPNFSDRNFIGTQQPATDASQDWATVSNDVSGSVRTLIVTRALTNSDVTNDFQFPYDSTNSISIAGVRPGSATFSVSSGHGGTANAGYASASFTTLGVEYFSLNTAQIYPNPSNNAFTVKTKADLKKINIYTLTGVFVKTIANKDAANTLEVNVDGLQSGIYFIELVNAYSKSWKKIIVN